MELQICQSALVRFAYPETQIRAVRFYQERRKCLFRTWVEDGYSLGFRL